VVISARRRVLQWGVLTATATWCGMPARALAVALQTPQWQCLQDHEVDFLRAALDRLIPTDQLGPGANDAGVLHFIDQQLAGDYGAASSRYMQGPFVVGTPSQGDQAALTPRVRYRTAIEQIDAQCRANFAGQVFARLNEQTQDEILQALEAGRNDWGGAALQTFFRLLWQNTQEGYFADPHYGGNQHFAGWRLIGFPGPRYNYVEQIAQFGVPYREPTVGLDGRSGVAPEGRP
jgi:gluconate 2-dehydrogenase gamma chain